MPKPKPQVLYLPERKAFVTPEGLRNKIAKRLHIRYVTGLDKLAIIVNALTLMVLFSMMSYLISMKKDNLLAIVGIPLGAIWLIGYYQRKKLTFEVNSREAAVFQENLWPRRIVVYTQGWNMVPWYYKRQPDLVSFQKHEIVSAEVKDNKEIRAESQDGYGMIAEVKALFNLREGEEAMSHSLKFQISEMRDWIISIIIASLTDAIAANPVESLLYYKIDLTGYLAQLFDGEGNISALEELLGIDISNPILLRLNLDEESRKIFEARARLGMVQESYDTLRQDKELGPVEAIRTAQVIASGAQRTIHTYEGIPEGVTVLALGESGIALASNQNPKAVKKGDKP